MEMTKVKKLAIAIILVLSATTVSVFAYEYFWRTDPIPLTSGIVLNAYSTPTMQLGVYWDVECTQPVTVIDFGEMVHPSSSISLHTDPIYIRNEGDVWYVLRWNSTLNSVTTEIAEQWTDKIIWPQGNSVRGYTLASGAVFTTYYKILVPAYATVGTYNWTLNLWAEHWY